MVYRVLVSHENVPLWTEKSIKGVGYQQHLYTRKLAGRENDDIERWFGKNFESPAEDVIQKVMQEQRLSPDDWRKLVDFLAMHDVRTPARLVEYLKDSSEHMANTLEKTLNELPAALMAMKRGEIQPLMPEPKNTTFPLRVTTELNEGDAFGTVKVETAVGRASWLWAVEHSLSLTVAELHRHRWTIMRPAQGMSWFTTDKPVIRLNYHGPGKYDFKGGWGSMGTEILMPLSPEHMLYTQIGRRPPPRGSRFSEEQTLLLRRVIAEHAHRFVYAKSPEKEVSAFMPRVVNAEFFKQEEAQWEKWHSEQVESEQHLFSHG